MLSLTASLPRGPCTICGRYVRRVLPASPSPTVRSSCVVPPVSAVNPLGFTTLPLNISTGKADPGTAKSLSVARLYGQHCEQCAERCITGCRHGTSQSQGFTCTPALHSLHLLEALLGQLTAAGGGLHGGTTPRWRVGNPPLLGLLSCTHSLQAGWQGSGTYTAQAVWASSPPMLGH